MPVLVSLFDLVSIPGTRRMWPTEFEELIRKIEENWRDRTCWGVVADWLEEDGVNEPLLAFGFRTVFKRTLMPIYHSTMKGSRWQLQSLPNEAINATLDRDYDDKTPAGAAAELAFRMKKAKEAIEEKLRDLE